MSNETESNQELKSGEYDFNIIVNQHATGSVFVNDGFTYIARKALTKESYMYMVNKVAENVWNKMLESEVGIDKKD